MPRGFQYPLNPAPRLAVFDVSVSFPDKPVSAEALAIPAAILPVALNWAWTPRFPVVVFTGANAGTFTESDRDRLWDLWGVPAFEFLLDSGNVVIAEECDAHDGLHLRPDASWSGSLVTTRCACGSSAPRIVHHSTARRGSQQPDMQGGYLSRLSPQAL